MSTSARHPSRWLALLALLACALAVFVIVSNGTGGGSSADTQTTSRPSSSQATQKQQGAKKRRSRKRTYRVQPGDTLSGIAAKTGVPLARIEQLNPGLDSQALQTGQKVKLGP
jgi:LysM repeat protein